MKFICSYTNNRKESARINESLREWEELHLGVPQGSVLGRLLLIIFLCDLFYFEDYIDVASYADDNTTYSADSNIEDTFPSLESSSARLFNRFQQNAMKLNPGKCHVLFSTN